MAANFHRRRVIVDRKLQVGLALKILGCLAGYMLLFGLLAVLGPFLMILLGRGAGEADVLAATERWADLGKCVAIPLILTFTCLSLHCILLSHRIAGPIHRMKQILGMILGGDMTASFHLRKDDYLKDLAAALDATVGRLRTDMLALETQARSISEDLAESQVDDAAAKAGQMLELLEAYRLEAEPQVDDLDAADSADSAQFDPEEVTTSS